MKKCFDSKLAKIMTVFFMITISFSPLWARTAKIPPEQFFLDFRDASLVYIPAAEALQIAAQGNVLSSGDDWEKSRVKPFLYHIRQKNWEGFYWKVNTGLKRVYQVTEGTFGSVGGKVQRLEITVEVEGGSESIPPTRFVLRFPNAYLAYIPASKTLQINAQGNVLSYGNDWEKCNFNSATYHLKQNSWGNFYWKITTQNPIVQRVKDVNAFCTPGAFPMDRLDVDIRIVN